MNMDALLNEIIGNLYQVLPESSLMVGAILILMVGLLKQHEWQVRSLFFASVVAAFYLRFYVSDTGLALANSLHFTSFSKPFELLFLLVLGAGLIFKRTSHLPEYYFLILAMGVGSLFMAKANSFLLIYLSVELVSFSSYILTGFAFNQKGAEAGIKYLLFGAITSAFMLVGLGLVYGTTGSFYLTDWQMGTFEHVLPKIGLLFFIFGILFKISLLPFHIWVPATYQVAPTDAVALMSIVPKIAGLLLLRRVLTNASLMQTDWLLTLIWCLGIATMITGTFGALRQSNTRRMVSFGAIAHSGFLLPFALINGTTGEEAFWWYAVVYAIMNLAVFFLLQAFEAKDIHRNEQYALASRQTLMGGVMTLVMISLVGIPPLAGFTAKFFLFSALWQGFTTSASTIQLIYLLTAAGATVASLFFYLRPAYYLFLKSESPTSVEWRISTKIVATIFAVSLLLLFFVPKLVVLMHQLLNMSHE
ncbi:MAG: NADH-quinone oxidoreductase subunit N [Ekhidna sp.]